MKSMKWAVLLVVGAALGFAGGVFAAGAKKEATATAAPDVKWTPLDPKQPDGPAVSILFGDMKKKGPIGFLLHTPPETSPGAHTHTSDDWAVVVKGTQHNWSGENEGAGLGPGSTWYQPGGQVHNNHCEKGSDCVVFVYMPNGFDFKPAAAAGDKKDMKDMKEEKKDMAKPDMAKPAK